ncbi:hypothetical protein C3E96_028975 (plasmid) [Klebsiella pneumoniae]|nr:hypothetical protein C3E96_028975 [Klebsiella pneumoniae]
MAVKRCRRSRKTGFQHVQESGSSRPAITLWQVAGRLTTRFTGDSALESYLESPRLKNNQTGSRV